MRTATPQRAERRGFTLMEVMVTVSVIGVLAASGTASYESARRGARDAKRVNDIRQVQIAMEMFYEAHGRYPVDGRSGIDPSILASEDPSRPLSLSDAGFSTEPSGAVYLLVVPRDPGTGTPYAYRSIQRDGRDCNDDPCEAYALLFTTEGEVGNLPPGPHAVTPEGVAGGGIALTGATTATGEIIGLEVAQGAVEEYVRRTGRAAATVVDNRAVERVAERAVAPAAAAAAAVNTGVAARSAAVSLQILFSFVSQPFLLLTRRRREQWGMVYNVLTRLPVDLAIVRLLDDATGRVVRSTVTDRDGRFSFLVSEPGRYRIEATKRGVVFPSVIVAGRRSDREFDDLYHGEAFTVGDDGAFIHPNIPVDPAERDASDAEIIREDRRRRWSGAVALVSPAFGAVSLVIAPSVFTALLFAAQVVAYLLFKRLAVPEQPKSWGVVHEERGGKPVHQAVLRIFEATYDKLLETQVTDGRGRYSFRVGGNAYYLTATKPGYTKTETEHLDLTDHPGVAVIATDLPLRKEGATTDESANQPRSL